MSGPTVAASSLRDSRLTGHIPRYVGEDESDRRGVKDGWYVVAKNGALRSGPFVNRQDCAQEIRDPKRTPLDAPFGRQAQTTATESTWRTRPVPTAAVAILTPFGPFWVLE